MPYLSIVALALFSTLAIPMLAYATVLPLTISTSAYHGIVYEDDRDGYFIITCKTGIPGTKFVFWTSDYDMSRDFLFDATQINDGSTILISNPESIIREYELVSKYKVYHYDNIGEAHLIIFRPTYADVTEYSCAAYKDNSSNIASTYLNIITGITTSYTRKSPRSLEVVARFRYGGDKDMSVSYTIFQPMYNGNRRFSTYKSYACKHENETPRYRDTVCKTIVKDAIWEWHWGYTQYHITSVNVKVYYFINENVDDDFLEEIISVV